ncbi:hypothetical protein SAY87_021988 [Trapa incisa]|uniref:Pentatricopeptide repeat-containing protein n=1 Tax=Trapa incisa TaxID=236973 RepID=A0AAN7JUV6_9MYRT|nr:hypothetical protein SAY87_021988 [Trapa incisa]
MKQKRSYHRADDSGVYYNDETYIIVLAQIVISGFDFSSDADTIHIRGDFHTSDRVNEAAILFNLMVAEGAIPESECLLDLFSLFACPSQLHMTSSSINKLLSELVLNWDMHSLLKNGMWKEVYPCKARQLLDLMMERGWIPDATIHWAYFQP